MKKILIIGLLAAGVAGVYAQGTLTFAPNTPNSVEIHVYSPDTASPASEFVGNVSLPYSNGARSGDFPTGTTVYTGQLVGGTSGAAGGPINYTFGNNFSAQIFASSNEGATAGQLSPVTQYTTSFRTTSTLLAGQVVPVTSPTGDPGIGSSSGNGTIMMVAWYNPGGNTYATLSAAQSAGVPWGEDLPVTITGLSESPLVTPPVPFGLQSFSLVASPEPSTIALGVMGACAFLFRRRK